MLFALKKKGKKLASLLNKPAEKIIRPMFVTAYWRLILRARSRKIKKVKPLKNHPISIVKEPVWPLSRRSLYTYDLIPNLKTVSLEGHGS